MSDNFKNSNYKFLFTIFFVGVKSVVQYENVRAHRNDNTSQVFRSILGNWEIAASFVLLAIE